MRKRLLVLGALALCFASYQPKAKADAAGCLQGINTVPVAYAFETITVSTSALPFTRSVYAPTGSSPANPAFVAYFSTETDTARIRLDGVAPTSSVGMLLAAGSYVTVCQSGIPNFKIIRSGSSDVPINVTYFRLING